jgi:hypothetical protein
MMRKIIVLLVVVLTLVAFSFDGSHTVNAQFNRLIASPVDHGEYGINTILLKVTLEMYTSEKQFDSLFGQGYDWYITYCVDGGEAVRIPKDNIVTGHTAKVPNVINANINLPQLADGTHTLKVTAKEPSVISNHPDDYTMQESVVFTIDTTSPTITNLSIGNQTYSQNNITLSYSTNESPSWIGYSLDGKANITLAGNTTLTELTKGPHNITIYANDSLGNIGRSESVNFKVDSPSQSSGFIALIVGVPVAAAVFTVLLVVYFKKLKNN